MHFLKQLLGPAQRLVFDTVSNSLGGVLPGQPARPLQDLLGTPVQRPFDPNAGVETSVCEYRRHGVWLQTDSQNLLMSATLWWRPPRGKPFDGRVESAAGPLPLTAETTREDLVCLFGEPWRADESQVADGRQVCLQYQFAPEAVEWEFLLLEDRLRSLSIRAGLAPVFNVTRNSLNGVVPGQPAPPLLDGLGQRADRAYDPEPMGGVSLYEYVLHGVWLEVSAQGTLLAFTLWWRPIDGAPFHGKVVGAAGALRLSADTTRAELLDLFGDPWWEGRAPEDPEGQLTLFYEDSAAEVEWEITLQDGRLVSIGVDCEPTLADEEERQELGCPRPWPPV